MTMPKPKTAKNANAVKRCNKRPRTKLAKKSKKPKSLPDCDGSTGSDLENEDHDKKMFACKICRKLFTSIWGVEQHYQTAHLGIRFKCHLCNILVTRKSNIKGHVENVHRSHQYHECQLCQNPGETKLANEKGCDDKDEVLEFSSESEEDDPDSNVNDIDDKPKCNHCQKEFSSKGNLSRHTRTVHAKEPLPVDGPEVSGQNKSSEIFSSEDEDSCPENEDHDGATKDFSSEEDSDQEAPAPTGKNDSSSTMLDLDLLKSTQPLKCKQCQKTFKTSLDLGQHIIFDHKGLPCFQCKTCGRKSAQESSLSKHIQILHDDEVNDIGDTDNDLTCAGCKRVFKLKIQLNRHAKKCRS